MRCQVDDLRAQIVTLKSSMTNSAEPSPIKQAFDGSVPLDITTAGNHFDEQKPPFLIPPLLPTPLPPLPGYRPMDINPDIWATSLLVTLQQSTHLTKMGSPPTASPLINPSSSPKPNDIMQGVEATNEDGTPDMRRRGKRMRDEDEWLDESSDSLNGIVEEGEEASDDSSGSAQGGAVSRGSATNGKNSAGPKPKKRRGHLPETATNSLKKWLFDHEMHPYPTEEEKAVLCTATNLSMTQINNWFTNARRRILKKGKNQTKRSLRSSINSL
jgi:hypothetical protein